MARRPAFVRDALPGDASDLLRLWCEVGIPGLPLASEDDATAAIDRIAESASERLLVADFDDRVVGAIHVAHRPVTPLHTERASRTSFLVVLPEFRRRGIARLLLDAAVTWAEEEQVLYMTASAAAASRDTNRFLARMGFSTAVTKRTALTHAVRAKLSPHTLHGTSLGQVMAQRRATRRRALTD